MKNRITWRAAQELVHKLVGDALGEGSLTDEQHGACLAIVGLADSLNDGDLDMPVYADTDEYNEDGALADPQLAPAPYAEPPAAAKYTDKELTQHVVQNRLDNCFGDGMERDYAMSGRVVLGMDVSKMTRRDLVEELESAGWFGDDE